MGRWCSKKTNSCSSCMEFRNHTETRSQGSFGVISPEEGLWCWHQYHPYRLVCVAQCHTWPLDTVTASWLCVSSFFTCQMGTVLGHCCQMSLCLAASTQGQSVILKVNYEDQTKIFKLITDAGQCYYSPKSFEDWLCVDRTHKEIISKYSDQRKSAVWSVYIQANRFMNRQVK